MGRDVGISEINGEVMHAFLDCTYIKNMSDKIEKIFGITLKNYVSPLEG